MNRSPFYRIFAIFFFFCLTAEMGSGQEISKVEYTIADDFETGELDAWEPYPYSQDIGYDALFFARKSPTYQNSRYAIARPVKSNNTAELEHGFTKRIDLWTTNETELKCAVYFQSDRNADELELGLGTFDGEFYTHKINNPKANQWLGINLPIREFISSRTGRTLAPGQHLQVVTVKGSYKVVYYLYTYTILMDNFSLNGEKASQFVAVNPGSINLDKFGVTILKKHYFAGDKISLELQAEEGMAGLREVTGELLNGKREIVKNNIAFRKVNEKWINESVYQIKKGDSRGQWMLKLQGRTTSGDKVIDSFYFLVPVKKIEGYPRLYFSAGELKDKLNRSPEGAKRILNNALTDTSFKQIKIDRMQELDLTEENLTGLAYDKMEGTTAYNAYSRWLAPMQQLAAIVEKGSFRYAFIGDREAAEKARAALLKLCSFENWNAKWMLSHEFGTYYPVGYLLVNIAAGYDMLHDVMTAEERKYVRDAIMEKGLKLFQRDMVEMNRMPSNMTNHIAVMVSGYGLAAAAIYGEEPDNSYLEPYLSGILTKAKTFMDRTYYKDGSYGEPTGYMDMASRDIVELAFAFERNFGVDLTNRTHLPEFYKYPLYAAYNSGLIQSYGDAGRSYSGFSQTHSQWLVHRNGDRYLYKYVKPYWDEGKGGYFGFLWYRDDLTPLVRDSLPTSRVFSAKGMVMRSGWSDRDVVITNRVGPNSNHYHLDQGTFQVMANGEELLTDPGIGIAGYYANPDYLSYNTQSIAHNVLLVDHSPESQNPAHYDNGIAALSTWPRMTHSFNSETADVVEGEFASVYRNKLDSYTRTLMYLKGGTLFLFDRVKSKAGERHIYDWLFHAPKNGSERSIKTAGNRLFIDRAKSRLTMDILTPSFGAGNSSGEAMIKSVTITDRNDPQLPESFVRYSTSDSLSGVNFFATLLPEPKPMGIDYSPRPVVEKIKDGGWIGAKVTKEDGIDYGFFREEGTASVSESTVSGFRTTGNRFAVSTGLGGRLQKAYFEGTAFGYQNFSIRSKAPVTCAVEIQGSRTIVNAEAGSETELAIRSETKPAGIILNSSVLKNWEYRESDRQVIIKIPAGRADIEINR
ncbi:MAG: heparinase II/III family protein [Chitinophagaceae bacterium]|nr:heparinase II/III family protein [Chitinophagaceae bacterium]